jgi:hypothetical protein
MLVARKPRRSTTTPPKKAASTIGRKLKKTASAVSVALPVVVSTYHGMAICATALPAREIVSATYSACRGVRLDTWATLRVEVPAVTQSSGRMSVATAAAR